MKNKQGIAPDPAAVLERLQRAWSRGGKTGGSNGGKARAANMTARQRREAARNAAKARWAEKKKRPT